MDGTTTDSAHKESSIEKTLVLRWKVLRAVGNQCVPGALGGEDNPLKDGIAAKCADLSAMLIR